MTTGLSRLFVYAFMTAACLSASPRQAQASPLVPTNVPGVFTFQAPPAGFDPLRATSAELERYGFPPRPEPLRASAAYEAWAHFFAAATRNFVAPVLRPAKTRHMPLMRAQGDAHPFLRGLGRNAYNLASKNWSGIADAGNVASFGPSSIYVMYGEWVVPIAQQAFGTCTGGTDYSATWMGIDGYNNNDVLQGGTESDAYCNAGRSSADYYVWFEWYPASGYEITNLPVSPGDDIAATLVAASSTSGVLYLTNETTNISTAVTITAPSGTHLTGSSCEWIVERPSVNNALSTLTNYVSDFMTNMVALQNNGGAVFGGTGTAAFPRYNVTMLDAGGNAVSVPFGVGSATMAFHDQGSAR